MFLKLCVSISLIWEVIAQPLQEAITQYEHKASAYGPVKLVRWAR